MKEEEKMRQFLMGYDELGNKRQECRLITWYDLAIVVGLGLALAAGVMS